MKKRLLALALCLVMALPLLASCAPVDLSYKGPVLQIYLNDQIYDFDPLNAYNNDSQLKVVGMLFATLFKVNGAGRLENDLVESCQIIENELTQEYKMVIKLKKTCWSDGNTLDSEDVITTFERILLDENSNGAAALLMDIKNAKAIKQGDATMGDLGVTTPNSTTVEIMFEHKIDYEQFKLGLASPAFAPLQAEVIDNPDWAKKPVTCAYSGPFVVRKVSYEEEDKQLILERNSYYYRNKTEDYVDKYVTPYRIIVDYTKSPEEQLQMYQAGQVLYVGEIAFAYRNEFKNSVKMSDALSTHTYYLNQNALIKKAGSKEGVALFADAKVRNALSLVIDRQALADLAVYAAPATGIVPSGIFAENASNNTFRVKAGDLIAKTADVNTAKQLLAEAGVNGADYTFSISVREGDAAHLAIAEAVAKVWKETLGFNVSVKTLGVEGKQDNEKDETGEVQKDIRDDLYNEALAANNYEVLAIDLVATSVTAASVLAPFAYDYSGNKTFYTDKDGKPYWEITPHTTGYASEEYNTLIKNAYTATNVADKTAALIEAEKLLVADMPAIPLIFNKDAYLASGELRGLGSYYMGFRDLKKVSVNNWEAYGIQYGFIEKED